MYPTETNLESLDKRRVQASDAYDHFQQQSKELWPNKTLKDRRVYSAICILKSYIIEDDVIHISSEMLNAIFGTKDTMARKIADECLIRVTGYQVDKYCIGYKVDPDKVNHFIERFNIDIEPHDVIKMAFKRANKEIELYKQQHHNVLTNGNFEYDYNENCYREFNAIQFIPRELRDAVLSDYGWKYQSDIDNCHIMALLKYKNDTVLNKDKVNTNHIEHYLKNRNLVRREISMATGISINKVKKSILSILNTARLGKSNKYIRYAIYELINDETKYNLLIKNELFLNLVKEIRSIIKLIKAEYKLDKACDYFFAFEQEVREQMKLHLNNLDIKYFNIHDAMVTNSEDHLEYYPVTAHFKRKYKINIKFSHKLLNNKFASIDEFKSTILYSTLNNIYYEQDLDIETEPDPPLLDKLIEEEEENVFEKCKEWLEDTEE